MSFRDDETRVKNASLPFFPFVLFVIKIKIIKNKVVNREVDLVREKKN